MFLPVFSGEAKTKSPRAAETEKAPDLCRRSNFESPSIVQAKGERSVLPPQNFSQCASLCKNYSLAFTQKEKHELATLKVLTYDDLNAPKHLPICEFFSFTLF
jgi:hypothetical protein